MLLNNFPVEWMLRIIGECSAPQTVVQHFAAWVNYYNRADELTFYNDEYDDHVAPQYPPKPQRRPTTETPDDYKARIGQWEVEKAQEAHITKPGNAMRASYYVEKILPSYREAYSLLVACSDLLRADVPIQQRHTVYKHGRGVVTLPHPANSPDLNPIEGIWNIIKERVKQQLITINSIAELKAALQHEWKQIRQEMVQERVNEISYRCRQVFQHPNVWVKIDLWYLINTTKINWNSIL
ncbi:hypothetical protein BU25DRAFT_437893 [Macroventuria anomochaeta]|uniref:Uncharacterized protein n=1 Tax=Macroventuria anomochaeta TaxID=301207 RepID=A0ACB6SAW7_9PLEO|nr:uncharacterized protein BU25DRAFT_437893 [Macroventuria anomochaeta]KAF2630657.1 hypothetical protein BU25DRAFT_437893 [Macroventuria anomochaeta]